MTRDYRNEREVNLYNFDHLEQSDRMFHSPHRFYIPERRTYSLKQFLCEFWGAIVVAALIGFPLAMYFWKGMN